MDGWFPLETIEWWWMMDDFKYRSKFLYSQQTYNPRKIN